MLQSIFHQFQTIGTYQSAVPFGSGHINDTYLVTTSEPDNPDYILQRINHHIFKNPPAMMNNILQVTQHLRRKSNERTCLTLIKNLQNEPAFVDDTGNHWACYLYIKNSYAHDIVKNPKQAYEGGKLIGQFLQMLNDFPVETLHETLPQFHDIEFRLNNFERAVKEDGCQRAQDCQHEIAFVRENAAAMMQIKLLGQQGKIPLRVVHNDTKFNNLLLDENDNGLCVIDLDTVMPGYVHYDFSDAVRTVANSSAEDEKDLTKIQFNMEFFTAFAQGFLHEMQPCLLPTEIETLATSIPLMPFIQGTRFLTDYLSGDQYFKIHFPAHNLQRTRAQFQLVRCMQEKMREINEVIYRAATVRERHRTN